MGNGASTTAKTGGDPFIIAGWRVDPASLRISGKTRTVKLEPKVMSLLVYLGSRPGQVISRRELEDSIWSGTIVGYDALSNAIIKLRKAFDDKARNPKVIETISKAGYRLIAEVSSIHKDAINLSNTENPAFNDKIHQDRDSEKAIKSYTPAELINDYGTRQPTGLSIAVLPFDNMSGDPEQDYFSDGISEDITTDLSKTSGLRVIARNSAFAYKGKAVKLSDIGQELGVRYLLEGSVRKAGQRIRINAQMIDTTTDSHVWAERYDRDLVDIFSVQDEVTQAIVSALVPKMGNKEQGLDQFRESPDIIAYDYFLKGREQALQDSEESNTQAIALLEKVIETDPKISLAYSYLGRCFSLAYINSWGNSQHRSLKRAMELGRKAVALDANNSHAHFVIASSAFWLGMNKLARREVDLALNIDSNYAEGYGVLAMIQLFSGEPANALNTLEITMRLDPHYRDIYLHYLSLANFHLGQYSKAIDASTRRLVRKPDSDISHALLATTYGHLGEFDKALDEWDSVMRVNPGYSLEQKKQMLPYQNPDDFDHFMEGFRKAGIVR